MGQDGRSRRSHAGDRQRNKGGSHGGKDGEQDGDDKTAGPVAVARAQAAVGAGPVVAVRVAQVVAPAPAGNHSRT